MPSTDFGSNQNSPGGYGGSVSGSVGSGSSADAGGRGGLTTGTTIYGNTAFGTSGGMADGYAMSTPGSTFGPSLETYFNFVTPSGTPMFGGAIGNTAVAAKSPQVAVSALQQALAASGVHRNASAAPGGLLDPVTTSPLGKIPSMGSSYDLSAIMQAMTQNMRPGGGPITRNDKWFTAPYTPGDYGNYRQTLPTPTNWSVLGGGGTVGYGSFPNRAGSYSPEQLKYYGGY